MSGNSGKLTEGSGKIVNAGDQFAEGIGELKNGADTLYGAILNLDENGIEKITDLAGGDVKTLLDRVSAIKEAGQSYDSFSGIADGKKGNVKFIIKTEGIEK